MGYFDSIGTKKDKEVVIDKTIIKNTLYQSKDFMYDDNDRYWQGDGFEITEDGYIYFSDEGFKNTKITGLANIYSDNLDYWLLIDQNKIVKAYQDMYYEELPKEARKDYGIYFGDKHKLDIDIEKLESKTSKRLLKKRKTKRTQKYNKYSNCKRTKTLKRKSRGKALCLKHLEVCIEKYSTLMILDEGSAFGGSALPFLVNVAKAIRKQNSTAVMATVPLENYK